LEVFDRKFSGMLLSKRGNMTRQDIEAYKYTFSRIDDWVGPINYFRTLLLRQGKYSKPFRKSSIPVLFIIGNCDPYVSLEMICKSSEYVDNFTLKIVEGGGHFLNQEMPNYINGLIHDFLKVHDGPAAYGDGSDRSILSKVLGAGLNIGNQVWSSSKDVVSRSIPKKS